MASLPFVLSRAQLASSLAEVVAFTDGLVWGEDSVWLAEAYRQIGQIAEGLRILGQALALACQRGAHFYEAELYRFKGELRRQHAVGVGLKPTPAEQSGATAGDDEPELAVAAAGPA